MTIITHKFTIEIPKTKHHAFSFVEYDVDAMGMWIGDEGDDWNDPHIPGHVEDWYVDSVAILHGHRYVSIPIPPGHIAPWVMALIEAEVESYMQTARPPEFDSKAEAADRRYDEMKDRAYEDRMQ